MWFFLLSCRWPGARGSRWLVLGACLWLPSAFPGSGIRAESVRVYDLDSLVYLSTEVAEAEVIRSHEAHAVQLIDVRVSFTHKGRFKKGQVVSVAHTEVYRKLKKGTANPEPLAAGDRLALFLVRAQPSEFVRIPADAVISEPLSGGLRLVSGGRVTAFSRWESPGPLVAHVPSDPAVARPLTLKQFRERVRLSLSETTVWARLIDAPPAELDVPRFLKLLAERSRQATGARDYFTERICLRLAESHNTELLSRALALATAYDDAAILQRGFGTPEGRDYLLTKVNDARETMPARLRYADALANAGTVYRSTFSAMDVQSWRESGGPDGGNSGYLTRIARAARDQGTHKELCGRLIRCLDYFGQGIVQKKPEPLMEDLRGALAVLKELYETKPSEELQFAVEQAAVHDRESYEKLKSPCGEFVSILRPADPARYTKSDQRGLIFEYEYATTLMSQDVEVRPSVALVHEETNQRYVLPTQLRIRGWSTGGGSGYVVLPGDLPAGKYRVYLQVHDGDKVISTGHHFLADL